MRTVIGLKLLQKKVKSNTMWFSLSTRKGATLSARLQWTQHINYFIWHGYICGLCLLTCVGYVDELLQKAIDLCSVGHRPSSAEVPESLCSTFERPEKSLAISSHKSRFSSHGQK